MNCENISEELCLLKQCMVTYRWSRAGSEDQSTEVGGALVAESTRGIDESTDTVGLERRAGERCAPRGADGRGFLRLEEFFLGVGFLGLAVGLAEDGAEDRERCDVVESSA